MKLKQLYRLAAGLALTGLIVGCTDDAYHINDADYLSRFTINDLAIPLKVETIRLDSIVDLTDGTNVIKYKDAEGKEFYALSETGTISSDPIKIDRVDVTPDPIESSYIHLHLNSPATSKKRAAAHSATYDLKQELTHFSYNSVKVDEAITKIRSFITVNPVKISLTLNVPDNLRIASTHFTDIRLQFPKGLKMADGSNAIVTFEGGLEPVGKYDHITGIVTINSIDLSDPHHQKVEVTADLFDLEEGDVTIDNDRNLQYKGDIGVLSGGFMVYGANNIADIPQNFDLRVDYAMDAFGIRSFSGAVDYYVEESRIDPIHLDDLPDFLQDPETNIVIADPQFYFRVTNSAAPYNAEGDGVITIKSEFANKKPFESESPKIIIPAQEITDIILSPTGKVEHPLEGYEANQDQEAYYNMKYILSGLPGSQGDGLPVSIYVAFEKPRFHGNNIVNFPVENDDYNGELAPMDGHYEFFAPLAFDTNSIIVYKDKVDLSDSEMEDIYVEKLKVDAEGFSSFPVDVKLSAIAYDVANNVLGRSNTLNIPALTTDRINLEIVPVDDNKVMNNIDHLDFHATVIQEAEGAGQPLAPDQGLSLTDLKIRVTGYYEKDLKD